MTFPRGERIRFGHSPWSIEASIIFNSLINLGTSWLLKQFPNKLVVQFFSHEAPSLIALVVGCSWTFIRRDWNVQISLFTFLLHCTWIYVISECRILNREKVFNTCIRVTYYWIIIDSEYRQTHQCLWVHKNFKPLSERLQLGSTTRKASIALVPQSDSKTVLARKNVSFFQDKLLTIYWRAGRCFLSPIPPPFSSSSSDLALSWYCSWLWFRQLGEKISVQYV
jgi:hypothetical protein